MYYHPGKKDEAFTESFGEKRAKKKELTQVSRELNACMSRIYQEMWRLFPRNATVFMMSCERKSNGSWEPSFYIYMTRDPNHEKPKTEKDFLKDFNISKEQLAHLKDVVDRSMRYMLSHCAFEKYQYDIILLYLFYDGSGQYRLSRKTAATGKRFLAQMVEDFKAIGTSKASNYIDGGILDDLDTVI
jgi:hypothetical protein